MSGKTLKHELYKHGSYLHSLKESGSEFVNIDDEIEKVEELFQLASKKDRQPTLAVGEYYLDKDVNRIVKIENHETGYTEIVYLSDGKLLRSVLYNLEDYFEKWNPATAEQIATFRRAEHFASKGRKLDEFRVGDRVSLHGTDEIVRIEALRGGAISGTTESGNSYSISSLGGPTVTLFQTAEELQEVENNE
ncbi:hypothetical protein [Enterococcus sp. AZ101]|uniref:hypothetical protein n=1 Tax=Enterococcus sp. AZ101 TaxID=2774742 RepID=UPI003D2DDF72